MVSVIARSLRLLVVVVAVIASASSSSAATPPTLSLSRELAGSSDGGSATIAPTPTSALPEPTATPSATPKTPAPTTEKPKDETSGSKDAGSTTAPPTTAPTPSPKKSSNTTTAPVTDEPVAATVKTRSAVTTTTTTAPVADEAGVTGNAALTSGDVKSEYGTKAPTSSDAEETVSTSSASKSSSGWIVPVIIGCVIVSALVVVTFYVRHKRNDDDDDDDDVDDFQRRTNNNFMPHPRTTNHQVGFGAAPAPMNMQDLEPPLFKPKAEPASVPLHAVSMQPTAHANANARKFSIPMLQSPVRASGESIDGRDTVSRVTSPGSLNNHERITARFTSASMSGVTL